MHGRVAGADRFEDDGDDTPWMYDADRGVRRRFNCFEKERLPEACDGDQFPFRGLGEKEGFCLVKGHAGKAKIVGVFIGLAVVLMCIDEGDLGNEDFCSAIPD